MSKWLCLTILLIILLPTNVSAAKGDKDDDGLSDEKEAWYYTDPDNPDTDGDSFRDGVEVEKGYSPRVAGRKKMHEVDYDNDGLNDWLEIWFNSDMGEGDSDNDGYNDFEEVMFGYSPTEFGSSTHYARRMEVDRTNQRLYYFVDKVKVLNLPVSTGNPGRETPKGEFTIQRKVEKLRYKGDDYDYPNVLWNMQFKPRYFLHSTYWHNDFGKRTRSHGCVNMRLADAELLYKYVEVGMPMMVTGTTPRRFYVGT